ncbi:MAG: cell division protein ZapA [Gammaproteobacteria bacterium]|nr:cell division protein ZapA [Gammaproteobacteria bacterium]
MTEQTVTTTIEILGKLYPVKCVEGEVKSLQLAAEYLNEKMSEVRDSGKAINLERIAIITALNVAHQFLMMHEQKNALMDKINNKITQLQDKIDTAFDPTQQTEFIYSSE